jgi:hypothetical protein
MIRRVVQISALTNNESLRAGAAHAWRRMHILLVVPRRFVREESSIISEDRTVIPMRERPSRSYSIQGGFQINRSLQNPASSLIDDTHS